MDFFRKLRLQEKVTSQGYLHLCNDVANGKLRGKTRSASGVLLEYLLSQEEAKLHGFHSDPQFLQNVSKIAFVCPAPLPELEWIHKVPQTPNSVVLANEVVPLCKLSGSCLVHSKELVWTVVPIVSVSDPQQTKVLEGLGIQIQPNVQDVVENMKTLSRSCFANPSLFETYSAPHCQKNQLNLMDVCLSCFTFLQSNQSHINKEELKMICCIPVYNTSQYPVLVEPHRVVCRTVQDTKYYYPYIHSLPDPPLYAVKQFLNGLGVEDSIELQHIQIVLESTFKSLDGLELNPNSREVVQFAVGKLNSLLKENEENKIQKMGEEAITEKLTPLYLSGIDAKMHHVNSLVYSHMRNVDLRGTNLHLLWTPKNIGIYAKKFCVLLPKVLRPRPLSMLCFSKVSDSVELCEHTECAHKIEATLKLPALPQGMCTVVRHVLRESGSSEKENLSDKFQEHLDNFLGMLKIRCVKCLTIDVTLRDHGKCIAVESKKCYVQKEQSLFCLYLDSSVSLMDISDVRECIADELVYCLRNTAVDELDFNHIRRAVEYLLRANSSDEVYNYLRKEEIHFNELECEIDFDFLIPKLGDRIPISWHFRLDPNNNNIFRPQEWVGYELVEGEYIFAQVVYPVALKDSTGEQLKPIQIKYVIFISDEDEEGKEVKAIELFKFTMGKESPQPIDASKCRDVVPFVGDHDDVTIQGIPIQLQRAKDKIREELRDIWQLPVSDRKRAICRLYLKYHPDRNLDNVELAEEAFKFLLEELDRLERSEKVSPNESWRAYRYSWNRNAHDQKRYSQHYYNTQSSSGASYQSSGGGWGGGGGGGGGGFFGSTFPRQNILEGKRWVEQAKIDLEALEVLLINARENTRLSSHVCFMAHEVAEKALKGGMYATCGLGENSLKSHNISPLAHAIEAERPVKACGLAARTSPLEPYYLDTRFPNRCLGPSIPSDNFSLSAAEAAAEYARGVLKIVRDVLN